MKKIILFLMILLQFSCAQETTEYVVEPIADGFNFIEGPVFKDGKVLFSDIPENTIFEWTEKDSVSEYYKPSGNSNGLALDGEGELLLAQHGKRSISKLTKDREEITLVDHYKGKKLNSPNDLTLHSDGSIYFTDPPYGINPEEEELGFYGIYKLNIDGEITLLDKSLIRPNGICLSLDEKKLYVADSKEKKIFAWDVDLNGLISNKKLLVHLDSDKSGTTDGMKMGKDGNIYTTGPGGIWVIKENGEVVAQIDVPGQNTNCNWGNDDQTILYVTSAKVLNKITIKK